MRKVAIVSVAQSDHRRAVPELNEVEMVQPVIQAALEKVGAGIADIDFTCSGSSDYLAGQAFSFVMTLDALGAWPPIAESHVEMDGAWALYEAWLKIQAGHAQTALVYGYSKASPGDLPTGAESAARSLLLLAVVARLDRDGGVAGPGDDRLRRHHRDRDGADRTPQPDRGAGEPHAQLKGSAPVEELLACEYICDPLRRHDCAPITDGAVAVVLAADEPAREWVDRPAWLTGIDHRVDSHNFGARDITSAPSVALAARNAGVHDGPLQVAELCAPFTHQEMILRNELSLGEEVQVNPSGGALAANPIMGAGLIRLGEVADRIMSGEVDRGVAHATSGHLLQQNLLAVMEGDR
ncbi:MAG: lipid-transfer protein [Microthrixaceae bacterium]|nr:lipid-transfer protein [Microthrixaceae bacterium]